MLTSDFDFELPESFIAQNPASPRDHSKLMVVDTAKGAVYHRHFYDLAEYLGGDDVLVLNRSKVIPARLAWDNKEIFILKDLGGRRCNCLVRPGKFFRAGRKGEIDGRGFEVLEVYDDGRRLVEFDCEPIEMMEKFGEMPLPPYIKHSKAAFEDYQTVYANEAGSVAAPTAGLHFTEDLLGRLKNQGVDVQEVVLYVGMGTFMPVSAEKISDHKMHFEEYEMPLAVAEDLNGAKADGKRIVAVGTTSVRVLESTFEDGAFVSGRGDTDIFIYPGSYQWKCVDSLITNFHLPKSTLLMLVASFLESKGVENPVDEVLKLYEMAKEEHYRFYSFGDAMLII